MHIKLDGKYIYRNGEKVKRIVTINLNCYHDMKVISESDNGILYEHFIDGTREKFVEDDYDLIEIKEQHVIWLLLYEDGSFKFHQDNSFLNDSAIWQGLVEQREIKWDKK